MDPMKNKISRVIRGDQDEINIHWYMTSWCNYRCPYCNPDGIVHPWTAYEEIVKTAKKLNIMIDNIPEPVTLFLVGGEVTYYDLKDLLQNYLTSKNLKKLTFITNLSRPLEFFMDLKNYCNSRGLYLGIRASVHQTQIPDLDEFLDKVEAIPTALNIVLNSQNYEQVDYFLKKLKSENRKHRKLDVVFDRNESVRTPEELEVYEYYNKEICEKIDFSHKVDFDNGEHIDYNRSQLSQLNYDFTGYKCEGILRIYTDGTITSGACWPHNEQNFNINTLSEDDLKNIKKLVTVTCSQRKCNLCVFKRIWKE